MKTFKAGECTRTTDLSDLGLTRRMLQRQGVSRIGEKLKSFREDTAAPRKVFPSVCPPSRLCITRAALTDPQWFRNSQVDADDASVPTPSRLRVAKGLSHAYPQRWRNDNGLRQEDPAVREDDWEEWTPWWVHSSC